MTLYFDSEYPVPELLDALHGDELESFSRVGTWGSAAERHAVAAATRRVRCEMGVQEATDDELERDDNVLPAAVERVASEVARGGSDIDRAFCEQAQADGVTEGAYVEIVSVASRVVNLDVFARGLGIPMRSLLAPEETGAPSFARPAEATDEGFFTATVPNAPAGGATAERLYGKQPAGNILRTLSLVPEEAKRVMRLVNTQYFDNATFMDFFATRHHALTRPQIELVATKVSAHNQCFY